MTCKRSSELGNNPSAGVCRRCPLLADCERGKWKLDGAKVEALLDAQGLTIEQAAKDAKCDCCGAPPKN